MSHSRELKAADSQMWRPTMWLTNKPELHPLCSWACGNLPDDSHDSPTSLTFWVSDSTNSSAIISLNRPVWLSDYGLIKSTWFTAKCRFIIFQLALNHWQSTGDKTFLCALYKRRALPSGHQGPIMWPHGHMTADHGFPHLSPQCIDLKI